VKFILLVEGETERKVLPAFLKRWLDEHSSQRVGLKAVKVKDINDLTKMAQSFIKAPENEDILAVIGLLDLYGLKGVSGESGPDYSKSVMEIEGEVNHPKFRMFFAVHELEAWLLSQPDIFHRDVRVALKRYAKDPESVDFNKPPSKVLSELYWGKLHKKYKKTTDGTVLFSMLDPHSAHSTCRHLADLLDTMLGLAQKTGT